MAVEMMDYESAYGWVNSTGAKARPHLLLGNGFSVAFDKSTFSYGALLDYAKGQGNLRELSAKFFFKLDTSDFELVIRQIMDAATALEILDAEGHSNEIKSLRDEASSLKELLARSLASLHPERPAEVSDDAYLRAKEFINRHSKIYTANYDLLLYWTLMQESDSQQFSRSDDGFRSPEYESEYVVWNHLDPHQQTVYYLHGALHLYRDIEAAELQKLTWIRTGNALVDQIRSQLSENRFPLIVTEGTSSEKLAKIQTSDYLARGLRSLAAVGGGLLAYGLSFSENDSHISRALVASGVKRVAVSIYGDPSDGSNRKIVESVNRLVADRQSRNSRRPLEVAYYDAGSVPLW